MSIISHLNNYPHLYTSSLIKHHLTRSPPLIPPLAPIYWTPLWMEPALSFLASLLALSIPRWVLARRKSAWPMNPISIWRDLTLYPIPSWNPHQFAYFWMLSWTPSFPSLLSPDPKTVLLMFFECTNPKANRFWTHPHITSSWIGNVQNH